MNKNLIKFILIYPFHAIGQVVHKVDNTLKPNQTKPHPVNLQCQLQVKYHSSKNSSCFLGINYMYLGQPLPPKQNYSGRWTAF